MGPTCENQLGCWFWDNSWDKSCVLTWRCPWQPLPDPLTAPRSYLSLLNNVWARKGMGRVSRLGCLSEFTDDLKLEGTWLTSDLLLRHKAQSPPLNFFPWLLCSLPNLASFAHRLYLSDTRSDRQKAWGTGVGWRQNQSQKHWGGVGLT